MFRISIATRRCLHDVLLFHCKILPSSLRRDVLARCHSLGCDMILVRTVGPLKVQACASNTLYLLQNEQKCRKSLGVTTVRHGNCKDASVREKVEVVRELTCIADYPRRTHEIVMGDLHTCTATTSVLSSLPTLRNIDLVLVSHPSHAIL